MKKLIILVILLGISTNCFGMTLSQEQYDNLDYIDAKVRDKYPQFNGFSGPKNNMKIYGVSEKAVEDIIRTIDFDKLNAERYEIEQETSIVRDKLIDNAISELESSGTTFKHKDKVKQELKKERS